MNPLNIARTRCIDIGYKWVIDRVKKGLIKVVHIPGRNGSRWPYKAAQHRETLTICQNAQSGGKESALNAFLHRKPSARTDT
ncbi:hypothetical protein B0T26DRAFT_730110 [Lasiosphaeria miniovina]|uniref:Uncharacterized protein n=1 Tax=Lasiosphaeria miniovina TaxID=1954250 RepID=A0AA40DKI9_9PEZI|nr:uncharacterized protein B0T26DRAFT_730110 [Lasiosphaeria miniovina]KAK0703188.1 hypothetical protein B0T26DRAFT_730110 [Lasiosphaeria miniovina]